VEHYPGKSQHPRKHSKLGLSSLIIALAVPVLLVLLIVLAMLMPTPLSTPRDIIGISTLVFALLAPLFHLVGAVLGVAGWLTRKRKLFPVVGTVLNLMLGVSGVLLWTLFISNMTCGFN
jgi:hypothetical protein